MYQTGASVLSTVLKMDWFNVFLSLTFTLALLGLVILYEAEKE